MKISGIAFYLRTLSNQDLNEEYLSWLNDAEVNKFLDVRFSPPNKKKAEEHLTKYDNKRNFFFGIFDKKNDKFIGTITLQIDSLYKTAYYGYLIGDKSYWGTKAAIDSIALLMDFGFESLGLRKIWGGCLINNIGSIFNFRKLGFIQEGQLRKHATFQNKLIDRLIFGILKKDWLEKKNFFKY